MLSSLRTKTMSLISGKFKPISTIPNNKLSSIDDIDISALVDAVIKKPTYRNYKTLLAHRRTLQCLETKMDLMFEAAYNALVEIAKNHSKTEQTLADACKSPYPITRPSIADSALQTILELQMVFLKERKAVVLKHSYNRARVQGNLKYLNMRIWKVEEILAKKYGIHTADDKGNPLHMKNGERAIHLMAWIQDIENL